MLARLTVGFNGAELANVVNEAAFLAGELHLGHGAVPAVPSGPLRFCLLRWHHMLLRRKMSWSWCVLMLPLPMPPNICAVRREADHVSLSDMVEAVRRTRYVVGGALHWQAAPMQL